MATQAGLSKEQIAQLKLKDRMNRLAQQFQVRIDVSDFSGGMGPDEEFRLYKGPKAGKAVLILNSDFWSRGTGIYDNDAYLVYLLFRAEAYYFYRSRYDAEHCAWIVEEDSPSMQILKRALNSSQTDWMVDEGEPSGRDIEFRRQLDPTQTPTKTLKALVEFALRAIAKKAADDWAELRFRKAVGKTSPKIDEAILRRERALAADFNRARSAMTRSERLAFQNLMKSPFRYSRRTGEAASDPVYDPEINTH